MLEASSPPILHPPDNWSRGAWMDYGKTSPSSILFTAAHPRLACIVVYGEWYMRGKLVREQYAAARDFLGPHADRPDTVWMVDRSAPVPEYHDAGCPVSPSPSLPGTKADMHAAVRRFCATGRILIVAEATPVLQWELSRLVYKPQPTNQFMDERDKPVKRDDHLVDPLCYLAAYYQHDLIGAFEDEPPPPDPVWPPPMERRRPKVDIPSLEQFVDGLLGVREPSLLDTYEPPDLRSR